MGNNIYRKIFNAIKKYDKIVITRHIGPDPDALGSSVGLKEIIKETFPNKQVYVVGCATSKFKYLGSLDRFTEDMYNDALLIVTDTPNKERVDGVDVSKFDYSIKIDHHPFIEKFCDIEWIDVDSSSASQLIMELTFNTKLKMTKSAAAKLFVGLVADTDRFLFSYTTPKTFSLVSELIKETKIDFTELYKKLYMRPFKEIKFHGYLEDNLNVTTNGFAYIKIDEDILEKYDVDAATAGNMVNDFNYIEGVEAWAVFSYDKNNNNIRGSIRSRGPIINEIASKYNGGGHKFASGVKLKDFEETDKLINDLDLVCKEYNEKEI
jgi:phosphoesterase RecJ-like protein